MARLVRLTPRYIERLAACRVIPGSSLAREAGATLRALAEAPELPTALDVIASIPPIASAYVRRVGNRNLWLWYSATESELVMLRVTTAPPVPMA